MNKRLVIECTVIGLLFTWYGSIRSEMGCMEKSLYLMEKYDPKVWHYVECNCPCEKYMAQCTHTMPLDRCPMCWHVHIPKTSIIVTKAIRQAAARQVKQVSPVAFENGHKALAFLLGQGNMNSRSR